MKPLTSNSKTSPEVVRSKRIYGMYYGAAAGLAFAAAAWGWDAYLLSRFHALYPWIKLIVGALASGLVGGLAGWLAARLDKVILSVLIWLGASALFAQLAVALPFQIAPQVSSWLQPRLKDVLNYTYYPEFQTRILVSYGWTAIFGAIAGALQLPLSEAAVFSTSVAGRGAPLFVCMIAMIFSGGNLDTLNNEPLRNALISVDHAIQYTVEHAGQPVDPKLARDLHLYALRSVQDQVTASRRLMVSSYDQWIGQVDVLVEFENQWVNCQTVYEQPTFCDTLAASGP